jgi:NADP-dependent 3-hydroxy acid dehydrogenase YdfG
MWCRISRMFAGIEQGRPMNSLSGKVVIVTGATSGIGAAVARACALDGASVVLAGRRKDRLAQLAKEITEAGGTAEMVPCDVTIQENIDRLFQRTKERFGPVSVLVNSAGIMLLGRFENGMIDQWRHMSELNLVALYYASHKAIEQMKGNGGGLIVHVSSSAALKQRPLSGVYAGTKAAVRAAAESMRQEVIDYNIRICTIMPGAVETELVGHITDPEAKEGFAQILKMKRLQAEDIANIVTFVAQQPDYVSINEIVVRPTEQAF